MNSFLEYKTPLKYKTFDALNKKDNDYNLLGYFFCYVTEVAELGRALKKREFSNRYYSRSGEGECSWKSRGFFLMNKLTKLPASPPTASPPRKVTNLCHAKPDLMLPVSFST